MTIWIGVDPGAKNTGIVAREGRNLLAHRIVTRTEDEWEGHGVGNTYIRDVILAIQEISQGASYYLAVEGVNVPKTHINGKLSLNNPGTIIGTGIVLGAILAEWRSPYPGTVIVPPEGNGSGMLATYPDELIGHQERARGLMRAAGQNSQLRHARSAWDVSLRGEQIARGRVA